LARQPSATQRTKGWFCFYNGVSSSLHHKSISIRHGKSLLLASAEPLQLFFLYLHDRDMHSLHWKTCLSIHFWELSRRGCEQRRDQKKGISVPGF
jgi:hypothetical protein